MNKNKILLLLIALVLAIGIIICFVVYFLNPTHSTELKAGSIVPEFTLPDQNGNEFDIKDVLGSKNLVIYFYPKDDTPGCTKEACTFRDQYEAFVKADALVIGISSQSVESHKKFADKYHLPFTLLADTTNKVRKLFGVQTDENGNIPGRVSFVVDKFGKIIFTFNSRTQPARHVEEALKILNGKTV